MLSLPSVTAPASRRRATAVHSRGDVKYSRVLVPHEVGSPGMWQRSLWASGTPCSGPRDRPAISSVSSARAAARAPSASTVMKARIRPSRRSMRVRCSWVASTGEIFRVAIARASVAMVQSVTALVLLALERDREAGRLLGQGKIGRRALDGGGEIRHLRADQPLWITHVASPAGS